MSTEKESNTGKIIAYLMAAQFHLKDQLKDYSNQYKELLKSEDSVFHDDIKEQYIGILKNKIVEEVSKNMALPADEIYAVTEGLDILAYLSI